MMRSPLPWLLLMAACYLMARGVPQLNYTPIVSAEKAIR